MSSHSIHFYICYGYLCIIITSLRQTLNFGEGNFNCYLFVLNLCWKFSHPLILALHLQFHHTFSASIKHLASPHIVEISYEKPQSPQENFIYDYYLCTASWVVFGVRNSKERQKVVRGKRLCSINVYGLASSHEREDGIYYSIKRRWYSCMPISILWLAGGV